VDLLPPPLLLACAGVVPPVRRLFLKYLEEAFDSGKLRFSLHLRALQDPQAFRRHLEPVRNVKWVVYAKPPFAGPQQVVDNVGRYTHRVAISNHRIVDIEGGSCEIQLERLSRQQSTEDHDFSAEEFIRRFLLHVLPSGFTAFATTGSSAIATARRVGALPPTSRHGSSA